MAMQVKFLNKSPANFIGVKRNLQNIILFYLAYHFFFYFVRHIISSILNFCVIISNLQSAQSKTLTFTTFQNRILQFDRFFFCHIEFPLLEIRFIIRKVKYFKYQFSLPFQPLCIRSKIIHGNSTQKKIYTNEFYNLLCWKSVKK